MILRLTVLSPERDRGLTYTLPVATETLRYNSLIISDLSIYVSIIVIIIIYFYG